MDNLTRRDFLKMGASLAALMGLGPLYYHGLAEAVEEIASGRKRILWLQGQSCTGCSVSFLNSVDPTPASIITEIVSLAFHSTISAAQGHIAVDIVQKTIQAGNYILVVEGSIPMDMPRACLFAEKPFEETLLPAIRNADATLAIGTCAAFGGMPAAEGNPTGAASIPRFMQEKKLDASKLLVLPTCPTHPETIVSCLAYFLKFGKPDCDSLHRPKLFYSCSVHGECPKYHYYQNQVFASDFGDEKGCLFKLGCLGPLSYANCPRRQWNNGINWCIRANAPCIACSSEYFVRYKDIPLYRKGEKKRMQVSRQEKKREKD